MFHYPEKQPEEERNQANATGLDSSATHTSVPAIEERRTHSAPCLDLLQVNRVIHDGATYFMYQRNTGVLPNAPVAAKLFTDCLNSAEKRLWLKDVELELGTSDMSLDGMNDVFRSKGLDAKEIKTESGVSLERFRMIRSPC